MHEGIRRGRAIGYIEFERLRASGSHGGFWPGLMRWALEDEGGAMRRLRRSWSTRVGARLPGVRLRDWRREALTPPPFSAGDH